MKYVANPVIVDAWQITEVGPLREDGSRVCFSGDRDVSHLATAAQMSRMTPVRGDYVVTQSDGYIYLNPKDVFERKYSPLSGMAVNQMQAATS